MLMTQDKIFVSVEAHKGRTIAAHLKPGTDLVSGIEAVCQKHHIQYGYFASVMGSLAKATYILPLKDATQPLGFRFSSLFPFRKGMSCEKACNHV